MPPKKKKESEKPAKGTFGDAVKSLLKKHSNTSVLPSNKVPQVKKLSTGIFAIDRYTGGGIPYQRLTMVHGRKSTGKSTFLDRLAERFLNEHPTLKAVIVNVEHTRDPKWSRIHVPTSVTEPERLIIVEPDTGEAGVDMAIAAASSDDIGLVIVDSIAMLTPMVEIESSSADSIVGKQARLVCNLIRRAVVSLAQATRENRPLIFVIVNQERAAPMGRASFKGPTYSKPGSQLMQDSAVSLDIRFKTPEYKKAGEVAYCVRHHFSIEKNKVGLPKAVGAYQMLLTDYDGCKKGDLDEIDEVTKAAARAGIISKVGGKVKIEGYDKTFPSTAEMLLELRKDNELFQSLKEYTLEVLINTDLIDDDDVVKEESGEE